MHLYKTITLAVVLCAISLAVHTPEAGSVEKRELGWVENARIIPENIRLAAKLDTGAATSSLGVERLTRFERAGRPWVRFVLSDKKGKQFVFERPIIRTVRVKRSQAESRTRPVIMLAICLAGGYSDETVTLATRSHLLYPLLIGRATLEERFLVNPSRRRMHRAKCFNR
jgi:hypothetical protein